MDIKPEEFHSKHCYDLFMYAVGLATQINEYIDKGYMVIDDDFYILEDKFIFESKNGYPMIKHECYKVLCPSLDDNEKYWLSNDEDYGSKNKIKAIFQQFKIVHPKHIKTIKFKKA